MAKITTNGTELFLVKNGEIKKVKGITGVDPGTVTGNVVDLQTWDDEVSQPAQNGATVSEATVSLYIDPQDPLHRAFFQDSKNSAADIDVYFLAWKDGKAVPEMGGDGVTVPGTRSFFEFRGWVSSFPMDFTGDAVQSEMVIQRVDKGVWHAKSQEEAA